MEQSKFYWLKLKRDFFKKHDIRIIETMPNGKDYLIFYLKLLCESIDHDGNLRFSDEIPYSVDMLSVITNTNVDIVKSAITLFTELKMMEILDDGTYYMSKVENMIGCETEWAKKKREYREKQKELEKGQCPTNVLTMSDKSKSIEKEIDIDKKENNNNTIIIKEKDFSLNEKPVEKADYITLGTYQRIKLRVKDYEKLKSEFNNDDLNEMIERLDGYVESNNNKNKYKNYNAVIRNAIREQWFKLTVRAKETESENKFAGFEVINNTDSDYETELNFIKNICRTETQRLQALGLLERKQPQWARKIREELGL